MTDVGLLPLRQQLTVDEAAHLLAASSGHDAGGLSDLMIEAIESRALPARIERCEVIDYWDGNYPGAINPMATTVQRADLDSWCQRMGITPAKTAVNAGEAVQSAPDANAGNTLPAVRTTQTHKGDKWTDEELRTLLAQIALPGMTHEKLAAQYGVTRQRIAALLKAAAKFKTQNASPFPTGVSLRKSKSTK